MAIPFRFWRNSRTNSKILKFSLKPSAIPGSFIKRAHPLSITLMFPSLHSQAAWFHSRPWSPEIPSMETSKGRRPKGMWTWQVGLVAFPNSDSPAHFRIPFALSMFSVGTTWRGKWERCAGRGNCHCSRGVAQGTPWMHQCGSAHSYCNIFLQL